MEVKLGVQPEKATLVPTVCEDCNIQLTNPNECPTIFKLKTTAPSRYIVKPKQGVIAPGRVANILITLTKEEPVLPSTDEFLVEFRGLSANEAVDAAGKSIKPMLKEQRQRKRFVINIIIPAAPATSQSAAENQPPLPTPQQQQPPISPVEAEGGVREKEKENEPVNVDEQSPARQPPPEESAPPAPPAQLQPAATVAAAAVGKTGGKIEAAEEKKLLSPSPLPEPPAQQRKVASPNSSKSSSFPWQLLLLGLAVCVLFFAMAAPQMKPSAEE